MQHNPLLEQRNRFGGTPLSTAVYGSVHGWRHDGNYPATIEALIKAGSTVDPNWLPTGNEAVDEVLRRYVKP